MDAIQHITNLAVAALPLAARVRCITWNAQFGLGVPYVLVQVRDDDEVREFARQLGVDAVLRELGAGDDRVEYLTAARDLEAFELKVMGPHHKLVRETP